MPALATGLLAAGIAAQWTWRADTPLPPAPPVRAARPTPSPPLRPVGLDVDIRDRALFSPSRAYRAADDRAATVPGARPATPAAGETLTLLGSARAGRRAVAVFRDGTGRAVTTPLGGTVSGWRLVALSRDRAVVARAGERRTLRLGATSGPAGGQADDEGGFGGAPSAPVDAPTGELGETD